MESWSSPFSWLTPIVNDAFRFKNPEKINLHECDSCKTLLTSRLTTLGEEILAGRKFGGNKIWRNWREFNLADAKKC